MLNNYSPLTLNTPVVLQLLPRPFSTVPDAVSPRSCHEATGQKTLRNIALKNADLLCAIFGPGKRSVAPGHEIVEMGLVKLYRITGQPKYLTTAKFFLDARGHYPGYDPKSGDVWKNGSYWQDDKPVVAQTEAEGHAVRAE